MNGVQVPVFFKYFFHIVIYSSAPQVSLLSDHILHHQGDHHRPDDGGSTHL
jgi:hypothetical protein